MLFLLCSTYFATHLALRFFSSKLHLSSHTLEQHTNNIERLKKLKWIEKVFPLTFRSFTTNAHLHTSHQMQHQPSRQDTQWKVTFMTKLVSVSTRERCHQVFCPTFYHQNQGHRFILERKNYSRKTPGYLCLCHHQVIDLEVLHTCKLLCVVLHSFRASELR